MVFATDAKPEATKPTRRIYQTLGIFMTMSMSMNIYYTCLILLNINIMLEIPIKLGYIIVKIFDKNEKNRNEKKVPGWVRTGGASGRRKWRREIFVE